MSEEQKNGALCFWLGFFLSLFGVLIAAIIGKGKGVIRAFQGMFFNAFLVVLGVVALCMMGQQTIAKQESRQKAERQAAEQALAEDFARQQQAAERLRKEESDKNARDEERRKRIDEIEAEKRSLAEEYRAVRRIADGLTGLKIDDPARIEAANKAESIFKRGSALTTETKTLKDSMGK